MHVSIVEVFHKPIFLCSFLRIKRIIIYKFIFWTISFICHLRFLKVKNRLNCNKTSDKLVYKIFTIINKYIFSRLVLITYIKIINYNL